MSIINRYSLYEGELLGGAKIRQGHGLNPVPSYREILAAEPSEEQKEAGLNYAPYQIEFAGKGVVILAIPHGLTTDPNNPIIPDVVIPVPLYNVTSNLATFDSRMRLVIDPSGAIGPASGFYADEEYVYLAAEGEGPVELLFFVYVEWTHSVIRNEIVTGAYEYLYEFTPGP